MMAQKYTFVDILRKNGLQVMRTEMTKEGLLVSHQAWLLFTLGLIDMALYLSLLLIIRRMIVVENDTI